MSNNKDASPKPLSSPVKKADGHSPARKNLNLSLSFRKHDKDLRRRPQDSPEKGDKDRDEASSPHALSNQGGKNAGKLSTVISMTWGKRRKVVVSKKTEDEKLVKPLTFHVSAHTSLAKLVNSFLFF